MSSRKGYKYIILLSLLLAVLLMACEQQSVISAPSPVPENILDAVSTFRHAGEMEPDDLATPPGGFTYAVNIQGPGWPKQPNWVDVEQSEIVLGGIERVKYRADINARRGQVKANIVFMESTVPVPHLFQMLSDRLPHDLNLRLIDFPVGLLHAWQDCGRYGAPFYIAEKVLFIEIPQQIKTGDYRFQIGVELNGWEWGRVPCVIDVME